MPFGGSNPPEGGVSRSRARMLCFQKHLALILVYDLISTQDLAIGTLDLKPLQAFKERRRDDLYMGVQLKFVKNKLSISHHRSCRSWKIMKYNFHETDNFSRANK
jgi:hypothetical protein